MITLPWLSQEGLAREAKLQVEDSSQRLKGLVWRGSQESRVYESKRYKRYGEHYLLI